VNDTQLKLLIAAQGDFGIVSGHTSFISPLERYVSARIANMDRTAVAMCADLLRRQRWLSTRILDAIACEYDVTVLIFTKLSCYNTISGTSAIGYTQRTYRVLCVF